MRRVRYDLRVFDDVNAIVDHIAARDPAAAAARFIDAFNETVRWLAEAAVRAARLEIEGLDPELRKWQIQGFPNHLLLHLVGDDLIEVIAVVDGRRDLPNALAGR